MDFEKISSFLSVRQVFHSAAELHGMICGHLCAGADTDPEQIARLLEVPAPSAAELRELLLALGAQARTQLQKNDYSFQPLLPDDEEELGLRLIALSDWCDGFNTGFGAGFASPDAALRQETQEVLKDFAAIAQVEEQPEDAAEQNEEHYMELVEYARMAAISVYLQNGPQQGAELQGSANSDDNDHGNDRGSENFH